MNIKWLVLCLVILAACTAPCPPGTTMGPDGVCCEGSNGACEEPEGAEDTAIADNLAESLESAPETGIIDAESGTGVEISDESEDNKSEETEPETEVEVPVESANSVESLDSVEPVESGGIDETDAPGPIGTQSETVLTGASLEELKRTYSEKVTSYQFRFGDDLYKVRDGRVRIELRDPKYERNVELPDGTKKYLFYYDVVYLDIKGKNATAYCEGYTTDLRHIRRECQQQEIEDIPLSVKYTDYDLVLPHEWLQEFYSADNAEGVEKNKYYLKNRAVARYLFPSYEVFFDPLNGLPIKLIRLQTREIVDYDALVINKVKSLEMDHRTYTDTL